MKITHYTQFEPIDAAEIEAAYSGVTMRRVISEVDGSDSAVMDVFETAPNGETPYHAHPWEHQVFVISGRGECRGLTGAHPFREGDVIHIKPNEPHALKNPGGDPVKLVCVIPKAALAAYRLARLNRGTPAEKPAL